MELHSLTNNAIRLQNIADSAEGEEMTTDCSVQAAEILNAAQDKNVIAHNGKDMDKLKDKDVRVLFK